MHKVIAATILLIVLVFFSINTREAVNSRTVEKSKFDDTHLKDGSSMMVKNGYWRAFTDPAPPDGPQNIFVHCLFVREKSHGLRHSAITIRVLDGKLDISIGWRLEISEKAEVQVRIDDYNIPPDFWELNDLKVDTCYSGNPTRLVKRLLESNSAKAISQDVSGNTVTAYFELRGLKEFLPYIKKAKNWENHP